VNGCRRVGIVIGQLSYGGAERQVVALAQGLLQSGKYSPVIFCLSNNVEPYGKSLTDAGIEWYRIPEGTRAGLSKLVWLVKQLKKNDCSVVYGILHIGNIYGGGAAMLLRRAFVASIRSVDALLPFHIRAMSSFMCKRALAVIANSLSCVNSLQKDLGVRHSHAILVPNAVLFRNPCAGSRERIRQELGIPKNAMVVGTVANLKKEKRFDFFLSVFHHCNKIISVSESTIDTPLHFVWIGDGPERNDADIALSQMSNDLRSRVHSPGARQDIAECFSAFDNFILTSAYEGMPNALLEAMAAGLPCVATRVPGTVDVLENQPEVGVLADPDDPKRFAESVIALLGDEGRRQDMGNRARAHVREEYALAKLISRMEAVFEGVLKGVRLD